MALLKTATFFFTLDLDLIGRVMEMMTKTSSFSDMKQMAGPIPEFRQSLIRLESPGHCHCLHCPITHEVFHKVSNTTFPFPSSRLSQACFPVLYVSDLKK